MTAETYFRFGCDYYQIITGYIEKFWKVITPDVTESKAAESKVLFDAIMQGMMIRIAAVDGEINHLQIDFIESIADEGDVLEYLSVATQGDVDLSWNVLHMLKGDALDSLSNILEVCLECMIEEFVKPFCML